MARARVGWFLLVLIGWGGSGILSAQELRNTATRVMPMGEPGRWIGFQVRTTTGELAAEVRFGSLNQIAARRVEQGKDAASSWLRFTGLQATPTPRLGASSWVTIRLYAGDPHPQISFQLQLAAFDEAAWKSAFGTVPFHFLACSLPGAEIFHQRGWSIMTPVLDPYPLQGQATGYGRQIVSEWSSDWTYAPPVGAWPVATVGLWKPEAQRYVGYDFHGARLTDHSEKNVASAYCWQQQGRGLLSQRSLSQFFTLVWPYARPYREELRYPRLPDQGAIATHFRLLYSLALPYQEDPNEFVQRFLWDRYADRLPAVPTVGDLGWLSDAYRLADFPTPALPGDLYGRITAGQDQWWQAGSLVFGGLPWDGDPVTYAYQTGQTEALRRFKQQIRDLLPYARRMQIHGEECVFWQQCLEGEGKLDLFGRGVPTVRHVSGWQLALALLDVYRNEPQAERELLPYIDGALRFTKYILTTRNCYPDVPAAQFCWSGGPATSYCLRYYFTFRDAQDDEHRELAKLAYRLAHRMLYRYLPVWASDNDEMDALDSAFFFEPNAGISWLGAACSNEVWVLAHALTQVYVHTGDPRLSYYLLGALERWHELYREEYYPSLRDYGSALTERLGLFDGAQEAKGRRAGFGGLWGLAEQLLWPVGGAQARIVCGEQAALAFNAHGRRTAIADYRYRGMGRFSFRLQPAAPGAGEQEPFDIVVTMPYFDLRAQPVFRVRGGEVVRQPEEAIQRYPQRPDSLLVRNLRYGDTLAVGEYDASIPVLPCPIAKARTRAIAEQVRWPTGFQAIDLLPALNRAYSFDWDDNASWAGWEPGRKTLYGVPFELPDPLYTAGRLAVRDREVKADAAGSHLFALVGEIAERARLTAVFTDGSQKEVDLKGAFAVLQGWPACFEWHVDWVSLPLQGKRLRALRPQGVSLFAATVASRPSSRLTETFAAIRTRQIQAWAEAEAVKGLTTMAPLFERASGRIAVLPGTATDQPRSHPLSRILHRAGLTKHLVFLSAREVVDARIFNAQRFWLTLYLQGEQYQQTVLKPEDTDQALGRYLRGGGALLVLPTPGQPFPFYYNESGQVVTTAERFGLWIGNAWEKPPAGHTYTFRCNPLQQILTSLPKHFPFPREGDLRWRPMVNRYGEAALYTPLLTLYDEKGQPAGEGAAWVEFRQGEFAGARVGYAWSTLVGDPTYQVGLVSDLLRHALNTAMPGLAEATCWRTWDGIRIDGKLDEPVWQLAPRLALEHCFGEKQGAPLRTTEVRCAWDDENLYLAFVAEDPDIWSHHTQRDANLWEGEVVEAYLDPDGDGRHYKEFEVNPRGAAIDLSIEDPTHLDLSWVDRYRRWDATGWRWEVGLDGTLDRHQDEDRRWVVETAIPFADLGVAVPKVGDSWRVQFFRIERPQQGKPEFSAWSATDTFHNPHRFGRLTFGTNPYREDFGLYPNGSEGSPTWSAQSGRWEIRNRLLTGQDSGTDGWHPTGIRLNEIALRDLRLSLRFRLTERGSDHRDGFWVGFRWQGAATGYSLNLAAAGAQLHKFVDGQGTNDDRQLGRAPWVPDDGWHTLVITARGDRIEVEMDGRPLLAARDEQFLGLPVPGAGTIILSARRWSQSQGHTQVEVGEVKVEPL